LLLLAARLETLHFPKFHYPISEDLHKCQLTLSDNEQLILACLQTDLHSKFETLHFPTCVQRLFEEGQEHGTQRYTAKAIS